MPLSRVCWASITRRLLLCAILLLLAGCGRSSVVYEPVRSLPGTTTTLILVRHADRDPDEMHLNAAGKIRAAALAEVLGEHGVTAIYCPDLERNRDTAGPLSYQLKLPIQTITHIPGEHPSRQANEVVDEILPRHAGGVVLFVGNAKGGLADSTGNLQEIYRRLGGTGRPPTRYQDLYIAVISEHGVHFIKATYGGPSALDR